MSDWKNVQYKDGKMRTSEGGGGGGSSTFAGLDDVNFTNVQNGQVPKYNSTTQKWENADESGGGGTVTDVTVDGTSVVNPQTGVAEITMPTPPTIPVEDVEVNGTSVVNAQNVAEIKSYKEVTQAEYNALPASKTSDGILYCIKDSAGADGFPPLIYSDEEREVGVWRDGKPLYQKVITTNNTTTGSWVAIDISALSIDTPCFWYGAFNRNIGGVEYWYLFDSREGGHDDVYSGTFRIDGENGTPNGRIFYKIKTFEGNNKQIFILQYTKTTDTAGSGTWTTQGGYAHHYSTTEQVIGTWIDGKPLYQKTIYKAGPYTGNLNSISIGIANIDHIITLNAHALASDNVILDLPYLHYTVQNSQVYYAVGYFISTDKTTINLRMGSGIGIKEVYFTFQYTKTTD